MYCFLTKLDDNNNSKVQILKLLNYSLLGLLLLIGCQNQKEKRPPNVIFILTDDQGYGDLGVYGAHDFSTPHLDLSLIHI